MLDLKGKTLLITGGTGSLGKALTKHILNEFPHIRRLIIFSRDEHKQNSMSQDYPAEKFPQIRFVIGDVRDKEHLIMTFRGVDYVIHAAAMKHVHIAENNPDECIKTNVGGAQNVISASMATNVKRVVALSTDKACRPVSTYGASKMISDKLFISANSLENLHETKFSAVRYGNVIGSVGSVVPYFKKLAKTSKVLPITNAEMSRFNITHQKGVDLIMFALENAWGGELFVPKCSSYRVLDLKEAICSKCEIRIIGERPGEKTFEEMITNDDADFTFDLGKYYVILPKNPNWEVKNYIEKLNASKVPNDFSYNSKDNDHWETVESLRMLIKHE